MPEQQKAMEQKEFMPPLPNWRCLGCGHEEYMMGMDEHRAKCPNCGSTEVEDFHLANIPAEI